MQITVTGTEFLVVEEKWVVKEGEGVEHVEVGLFESVNAQAIRT